LINEKYGTLNLSSLSRICEVVRELHAKGETRSTTVFINSACQGHCGISLQPARIAAAAAVRLAAMSPFSRLAHSVSQAGGQSVTRILKIKTIHTSLSKQQHLLNLQAVQTTAGPLGAAGSSTNFVQGPLLAMLSCP
jgi:hypothetical protein